MRSTLELAQRLWAKVDTDGPCWEWRGWKDRDGYGRHSSTLMHRWVYETLVGEIPAGLQIDHLCRNHGCVNPDHLDVVTLQENKRRGYGFDALNARKTHCVRGHAFTPENTLISSGRRRCRECMRLYKAMRRAA